MCVVRLCCVKGERQLLKRDDSSIPSPQPEEKPRGRVGVITGGLSIQRKTKTFNT